MRVHEVHGEKVMFNAITKQSVGVVPVIRRYAKCCGTCEYSQQVERNNPIPDSFATHQVLECHRRLPHPDHARGFWPTIDNENWCGEWALSAEAEPLGEGDGE
jgi:hypothetical protein